MECPKMLFHIFLLFSVLFFSKYVKASPIIQDGTSDVIEHHLSNKDATLNQLLRRAVARDLGYELVPGWLGYYKVHQDAKNWKDALEVCAQEGAHLLVINSPLEAEAVQNLVLTKGNGDKYHWVGFHDEYEETKYITIFNESLYSSGYVEWGYDEPDERIGENCGVFGDFYQGNTSRFSLGDFWCEVLLPFVCEEASDIQGAYWTPLAEYTLLPKLGFYKVYTAELTWGDAVETCEKDGTHLLVVSSIEEEKALLPLIRNTPGHGNYYWIGLHDQFNEGQYESILNESTPYLHWLVSQPTGGKDVDCVAFYNDPEMEFGFDDLACDDQEHFICEVEL